MFRHPLKMTQIICKHCLKPRFETDFYPYQRSKCKQCFADYNTRWAKEHPGLVKAKRKRMMIKHRELLTSRNRKRYLEKGVKRSPEQNELNRRYRQAHKLQRNVKARVRNEIKAGRMFRAENCETCSFECKTQAHHYNYDFPFSVVWLCASCHRLVHGKIDYPLKQRTIELFKHKFPHVPFG